MPGITNKSPALVALLALCLPTQAAEHDGGKAPYPVAPSIVPELREHTEHFQRRVYRVGDRVYSAVGWNISNIVMIEGDDGVVLVDAGLSPETSREVLAEFRKITDKPIRAVIYSHFHHDHVDGIRGLVSEKQVASGEVRLIAHESLLDNLAGESLLLGPILALRGGYTFGFLLNPADREGMNAGIGPLPKGGNPGTFIAPNEWVDGRLDTEIAGVRLQILHVPSEAPDELAVFLPDDGILIDTEVLQGPTYPNLYTLRGTRFRDPAVWVRSIDRLRALNADHLVPTHGQPVSGAEKVQEVLTMTRDGIQYVLDQTIRFMNQGYTPDELVELIALPPHLATYAPYLRQYYGTVPQAVRAIYTGYLGWYGGDPVDLDPLAPPERDRRLVDLAGGPGVVLEAAERAFAGHDDQWAAELATMLLRAGVEADRARRLKAAALRRLGYASMNINWRNWYLTYAMQLEGTLQERLAAVDMRGVWLPPDIVAELPAQSVFESLTSRLEAEETLDVNLSAEVEIRDTGERFGLIIRRGVCEFRVGPVPGADLFLALDRRVLDAIVVGEETFESARADGEIRVDGDEAHYAKFFGYFEDPWASARTLH